MGTHQCPGCGHRFSVPDWLKTEIKCPACRAIIKEAGRAKEASAGPTDVAGRHEPQDRPASLSSPASRNLDIPSSAVIAASHQAPSGSADVYQPAAPQPTVAASATAKGGGMPSLPRRLAGAAGRFLGRNKFLLFGLLGALGCLLGATFGEFLLALTRVTPPPAEKPKLDPQAVCLLLDCSGSMGLVSFTFKTFSTNLGEVKAAATVFSQAQADTQSTIAVVGFGTDVHVATPLTGSQPTLEKAIDDVSDGGSTRMDAAIRAAAEQLRATSLPRNILLFTDGMPEPPSLQEPTIQAAEACRRQGINIVAIATGGADTDFLARVTGDPSLVIPVSSGEFGTGFAKAAKVIYGGSLVELSPTSLSFRDNLLRIAGWTALLAVGLAVALIGGQNAYMHRRVLTVFQAIIGTAGGLVAGFVAGAVGQVLFSPFARTAVLQSLGTIVGWTVLGALVGRGMALVVTNLSARRAWKGGAVGGTIGSIAFLYATSTLGETYGRLLGASILGLAIGLLIAFVEVVFREAWLDVHYGPRESRTVNLGLEPVSVGSDSKRCTVFVPGAPPVAYSFRVHQGKIECQDAVSGQSGPVSPGDTKIIGSTKVVVRAKE